MLVSHPAVAEAAVIPSPDVEHGEVPKAFVVLKTAATAEELTEFVAGRVESYKKVRKLVIVDAIQARNDSDWPTGACATGHGVE